MRRGSQTQYVPHIGLPHSIPVPSAATVNQAPMGAQAAAAEWATFMRQMSPTAAATAMVEYAISDNHADGACTYTMRNASFCW